MSFWTSAWKIDIDILLLTLETHLEGEGDGLGDTGEVDEDGGAHALEYQVDECFTWNEFSTWN